MSEILILDGKSQPVRTATIRFVRDARNYSKGMILHCPLPKARRFVKEGFAEYLKK